MIFKSINARSKDARLYDIASGAMTNKVYADGKGPSYDYDAHGRLTKRTWARGIDTTYTYDAWGSLTRTDYSDSTPSVVLCYDAMGRQTRAVDAAGITTFAYDSFGSLTNETVVGVAGTNTIERFYDTFGRDAGYALNGVRQSTLSYDPATGRLATMLASGSATPFAWSYLAGSEFKSSLTYPNGIVASWAYDSRNNLIQVRNASTVPSSPSMTSNDFEIISQYDYTYDAAGRRISCAHSGTAFDTHDTNSYRYNARSELTNATATVDAAYRYTYDFDDIGNRKTSSERGTNSVYTASQLNQYTAVNDFTPTYDADGNETIVKTATGIWNVFYNGENRPILWTCGETNIVMSYDRMGRRVTKNAQRFVYNGYLQIANHHSSTSTSHFNYYIWDPTEPVATRPLVWLHQASGTLPQAPFFYTHDGNKNVSEVIASDGTLAAHYEYAPFGALTAQCGVSAAANPWRFSSEYAEDDTATVYYNYRHYEPVMGRWMSRDPIGESDRRKSLIVFCANNNICFDYLGLDDQCCCKICLYSAVDLTTVRKSGPVDVGEGMTGHTWINIESCSEKDGEFGSSSPDITFSFGPDDSHTNKEFFWGVPGGYWDVGQYTNLTEYAVAKKCWSQTAEECEKIREDLKDPYPEEFSLFDYCTNSAVDFLRQHGVDAPDGVGEIDMPWWFPNVDRANPKDMYEQIVSEGGVDISKEQGGF